MERTVTAQSLLERLACLSGCDYLSDLRDPRYRPALHRALKYLPPEAYPAQQWREVARYLSCTPTAQESAVQIWKDLLSFTAA